MKALRWLGRHFYPLLVVLWINGVILRLSLRDSIDLLAPLYYATPWPVLALLTVPFVWTFRRQPKGVFAVIAVVHLFGAAWILESWSSIEPSKEPAPLRVVQWNVSRPDRALSAIAGKIRAFDAEIVAVSEALARAPKGADEGAAELSGIAEAKRWRAEFPGYAAYFSYGNMLLLVRGEILASRMERLGDSSTAIVHEITVAGRKMVVVQVDLIAKPLRSRREPMENLARLIESLGSASLVVLGDFNTPRESVHFDRFRGPLALTNAFEEAGAGSAETWPMPIPVLSIDQIWSAQGLKPVRCRHDVSFRSDHRPVVAEFSFVESDDE